VLTILLVSSAHDSLGFADTDPLAAAASGAGYLTANPRQLRQVYLDTEGDLEAGETCPRERFAGLPSGCVPFG
jgi:hypothetical protein